MTRHFGPGGGLARRATAPVCWLALAASLAFGGCEHGDPGDVFDICGGLQGLSCGEGEYCEFPPDAQCGAADQTGFCTERPEFCTREFRPVCGCDDTTYGNACEAAAAGVSLLHEGECSSGALQLGDACGGFRLPGSPDCDSGLFCQHQAGALCGAADAPGECVLIPDVCADVFDPVCGCDGETYANACEAAANLTGILEDGPCP